MEGPLGPHESKSDRVWRLIESLRRDASEPCLSPADRRNLLGQLRTHGRVPEDADALYTKEGIDTVARHAFARALADSSKEALKCLANAFVLDPATRQSFLDLGYAPEAAERYKSDDIDDEFLLSRILMVLTYVTSFDFDPLFETHGLASSIEEHLSMHARQLTDRDDGPRMALSSERASALSETLKLLSNLAIRNPKHTKDLSESLPHLLHILARLAWPEPVLQPPVNLLINALVTVDLTGGVMKTQELARGVDSLLDVLDRATGQYSASQLEPNTLSLLTLLRKIYDEATPEPVRLQIRSRILPTDADRRQPLGKADNLAARLLNLSVSPAAPRLGESVSALLYDVSGKDAEAFVRNIGLGFASGFLLSHNLPFPQLGQQQGSGPDSHLASGMGDDPINPVTGQRLAMEPPDLGPEMTDEEKEREAERLFVLFERLKATGVVDVKNPMEQAQEDGRFEELE